MWAGTQAEREAMILDLAEEIDADPIAVGSRGIGPIKRLALGSVSTKVVRAARDPVLVYSYRRTQDRDYLYERRERGSREHLYLLWSRMQLHPVDDAVHASRQGLYQAAARQSRRRMSTWPRDAGQRRGGVWCLRA